MPARRAGSFGISDGVSQGAAPAMGMPYTGTGTGKPDAQMYSDMGGEQMPSAGANPTDLNAESPQTQRRRLMPIAGAPRIDMSGLQAAQHMLARRRAGG